MKSLVRYSLPRASRALFASMLLVAPMAACGSSNGDGGPDAMTGINPDADNGNGNPTCASLGIPVYIAGASAVRPAVREAQRALIRGGSEVVLIYQGTASCDGPSAVINKTKTTSRADYFTFENLEDPSSHTTNHCDLPPGGIDPDVSISDVTAETCGKHLGAGFVMRPEQREYQGVVQAMVFAVPLASTENAITSQGLQVVLGLGAEDPADRIEPWTIPEEIHNRVPESGTKVLSAENIGLLSRKWKGVHHPSNPDVLAAMLAAANPSNAIGLLAADFADSNRDELKVLAYQHEYGELTQMCGYLPDSASNTLDKINVREGRWGIFAPISYIVTVDGDGKPVPQTIDDADRAADKAEALDRALDFLQIKNLDEDDERLMVVSAANSSTVPVCAMRVTRAGDGGIPQPFTADKPCHCLFDELVIGSTDCATCTSTGDCGAGEVCSFGYCESTATWDPFDGCDDTGANGRCTCEQGTATYDICSPAVVNCSQFDNDRIPDGALDRVAEL
jgi:hypothetical protein